MAPPPVDSLLEALASWSTKHECSDSPARRADDRGEPSLGCASDPRRTRQTRFRRLGTDRIETSAPTTSAAVSDLANLPHESSDVLGVVGLLHGAHPHRTRPVRARAPVP